MPCAPRLHSPLHSTRTSPPARPLALGIGLPSQQCGPVILLAPFLAVRPRDPSRPLQAPRATRRVNPFSRILVQLLSHVWATCGPRGPHSTLLLVGRMPSTSHSFELMPSTSHSFELMPSTSHSFELMPSTSHSFELMPSTSHSFELMPSTSHSFELMPSTSHSFSYKRLSPVHQLMPAPLTCSAAAGASRARRVAP